MLRDRLVVGINDSALQQRLLAEPRLNLKKATDIALAHETAAKDSKAIQGSSGASQTVHVNHMAETKPRPTSSTKPCYRCGKSNHKAMECYYKETTCSHCKKKGHLAEVCRNRTSTKPPTSIQRKQPTHLVEMTEPDQEESSEYSLFTVNNCTDGNGTDSNLFTVNVLINKQSVGMQIDTGAAVSIMSEATLKQLWSQENSPPIETTSMRLSTYSGVMLETVGTITCTVEYQCQSYQLPLVIVKQEGPTLLGRNWLSQIKLNWPELTKQILSVHEKTLSPILDRFQEVFQDELGTYNGPKVKLVVDPQVPPKFYKPRPLPYAMRDKVEQQLQHLQTAGIIEHVESSEWATPVVPVLKCDKKTLRLCGDY